MNAHLNKLFCLSVKSFETFIAQISFFFDFFYFPYKEQQTLKILFVRKNVEIKKTTSLYEKQRNMRFAICIIH